MSRALLAALAVLVLAWPAVSEARSASKCTRVLRDASGEMLQNGCGGCRLVSVQRTRPGADKPTAQTLTVPEGTRQPLPFLGPGRTRITAERPCPGAAPEPEPLRAGDAAAALQSADRKCVRFLKTRTGDAALVNPCPVCRTVKVEFVDTAGNRNHRAFAIAPRAPITVPSEGLAKARILTDTPCG